MQSGNRVPDDVADVIDGRLMRVLDPSSWLNDDEDAGFDPASHDENAERALRAIRLRRGQADFRAALMIAYGYRCAVSNCAVPDVLEAAHIYPYRGSLTNHVSNGLLLRTDLHTLFDCGLLVIEPTTRRVVIAPVLADSSYAVLADRRLRDAKTPSETASRRSLEHRFRAFRTRFP